MAVYDADALEADLLMFDLPTAHASIAKRSALVPLAGGNKASGAEPPSGMAGGCFQTPGKRIGNLTINTIKRGALLSHTRSPLKKVVTTTGPFNVTSRLGGTSPLREAEDKENSPPGQFCPAPLGSSPVMQQRLGKRLGGAMLPDSAPRPAARNALKVDWDTLDNIVNRSAPAVVADPSYAASQNTTADDLEQLLFSQDPESALMPDIFLGYEDLGTDLGSAFRPGMAPPPRPRSSSMVSVQSFSGTRARPKIAITVRSSKRELPALRGGSQLRKMILPGEKAVPARPPAVQAAKRRPTVRDEEPEYTSFINKLNADGTPRRTGACRLCWQSCWTASSRTTSTTRASWRSLRRTSRRSRRSPVLCVYHGSAHSGLVEREIEGLFAEECGGFRPRTSAPEAMCIEEMAARFRTQVKQHYQLLVQVLALCSEIKDAEEKSTVMLKLMSQLQRSVAPENLPPGIQRLHMVLSGIPEEHRKKLTAVSKDDPMLRLKSQIRTLPPIFKHANALDPCAVSKGYFNHLSLFDVEVNPRLAINMAGTLLVDNMPSVDAGERLGWVRADSFLASEDGLLLLGMKKFGLGNWEMIQAQFLPTRATKQIFNRYKNLIARRAPTNPVKVSPRAGRELR